MCSWSVPYSFPSTLTLSMTMVAFIPASLAAFRTGSSLPLDFCICIWQVFGQDIGCLLQVISGFPHFATITTKQEPNDNGFGLSFIFSTNTMNLI